MEETLVKPGDIQCDALSITTHKGETIELKADALAGHEGFFAEVNIYEDIWNKFVTGEIVLRDAANMMTDGPIVGGETLTMKWRTNTFPGDMQSTIDRSFIVFGVYNRTLNNDREQLYILKFCSMEAYNNQAQITGARYQGKTDAIVKKIYDDYINVGRPGLTGQISPGLFIYDTPHASSVNFVSNQWTPFQCLDWLTRYTQGSKNIGSDFIFFESHKSFYYTSIQELMESQKDQPFEEYIYEMSGAEIEHRASGTYRGISLPKKYCTIDRFVIPRSFDSFDGQDTGYYAQQGRAYDLYSKERVKNELDVNKDFDKFKHSEDNAPIPEQILRNPLAVQTFRALNSMNNMSQAYNIPGSAVGNNDLDNVPANMLYRDNYFNSFKDYAFEIDVPGRTDIQAGDLIQVMYPSTMSKGEGATFDDIFDKKLTGKYLITAIRHKIDTAGHVMKMEIVKNSIPVPAV
tara:strand:+ start:749 stop:2131 length:1383 start_codon:yes stop_codon:yes gene_type:complete